MTLAEEISDIHTQALGLFARIRDLRGESCDDVGLRLWLGRALSDADLMLRALRTAQGLAEEGEQ